MNLRGAFAVAQEVARGMVKAGIPGVILNVSSVASIHSMLQHSVYSSAKVGFSSKTVNENEYFRPDWTC